MADKLLDENGIVKVRELIDLTFATKHREALDNVGYGILEVPVESLTE